jgi:hypothetical protein
MESLGVMRAYGPTPRLTFGAERDVKCGCWKLLFHLWVFGFGPQTEKPGNEENKSHDAKEYHALLTGDDERQKPKRAEQNSHYNQKYRAAPDLDVGRGQDFLVTVDDSVDELHSVFAAIFAREAVGHLSDAGATQSAST